jgi:RNA polymerase sigma factor (sigma-70 family)
MEIRQLYRELSRRLVGYATWSTGGGLAEAEDIVDDAFHDLCRQWSRVRLLDHNGRSAWLQRVVRNKAVSAYRQRRRLVPVDPLNDRARLDRPTENVDQAHVLLANDLLDQCLAVIHTLPHHVRLAIRLRLDGFNSREIGCQLGVDSSTVRGYWARVTQEITDKVGPVLKILDGVDGEDMT